jgi:hypothetical protein
VIRGPIVNADTQLLQVINDFAKATSWLHPLVVAYAHYGIVVFAALMLAGWWSARRQANPVRVAAAVWAPLGMLLALGVNQPLSAMVDEPRRIPRCSTSWCWPIAATIRRFRATTPCWPARSRPPRSRSSGGSRPSPRWSACSGSRCYADCWSGWPSSPSAPLRPMLTTAPRPVAPVAG